MNEKLRFVYSHCPGPIRSLGASLYGLWLQSWRYGPETEDLIEEALERETWPQEKWKAWQQQKLSYVLDYAAKRVPYYREHWTDRRRRGDRVSWEYLENWPFLTKESVLNNPKAFLSDSCNPNRMFHDHTGGTTGTPLNLWISKKAMRAWHAMFEARGRRWNDVSRHKNWATLGGQTVAGPNVESPPFWVWNKPMNQLYLSANHVSQANTPYYLESLRKYRVTHVLGYSSSLYVLAHEALSLGIPIPRVKTIITMAEPLLPYHRKALAEAFGAEVRETYGMSELVAMATECSSGRLHLWPEVGLLEVISDTGNGPVESGDAGRFVCTSLLNTEMPLIRYVVGDRGRLFRHSESCGCCRNLPMIAAVEGRTNDMLIGRNGRRVYWVNPIFYDLPIREAQVVQDRIDHVTIRYVATSGFERGTEREIFRRLRLRMGDVNVAFEQLTEIPRGQNGKFRAVICNVSS